MQWSVRCLICCLLVAASLSSAYESDHEPDSSGSYTKAIKENTHHRMVCENEKLQIDCKKPDHFIQIERAYYGRYSITPCNKYHVKYAKGCTANDTLVVLKRLCENKLNCEILADSSTFGSPCPNTVHILEVFYSCVKIIEQTEPIKTTTSSLYEILTSTVPLATTTAGVFSTRKIPKTTPLFISTTTTTTPSTTTSTTTTELPTTTTTTPLPTTTTTTITSMPSTTVDVRLLSDQERKYEIKGDDFGNEITIYCSFGFDNSVQVKVGEYYHYPCSSDSSNEVGTKLYICLSDGYFHLVNETCAPIETMNDKHETSLESEKSNSLELIKQMNEQLNKDPNGTLNAKSFIKTVVGFLFNASSNLYENTASKSQLDDVSNTIIDSADMIISREPSWKEMKEEEKSRSVTEMFDVVEKVLFDEKLNNIYHIDPDNPSAFDFKTNKSNIVAEVTSNVDLLSEIKFPINKNLNTEENVLVQLKEPKIDQKFMFIVYKNVSDLLSTKLDKENEGEDEDDESNKENDETQRKIINSNIISFKMNNENDVDYLKLSPIRLTFRHLIESNTPGTQINRDPSTIDDNDSVKEYLMNPTCAFWNYNKETYEGQWSTDGCNLLFTNKTHTICNCNHLTHFAVLMDVYGIHQRSFDQSNDIHQKILYIITIVCSLISCVCIILTLFTFKFIKIMKKNRENSTTKDLNVITTHLCVCLLLSLLTFLTGIFTQRFKLKVLCSSIALVSHYLFLCSFFWMLLEGVQLYLMLVRIFKLDKSPISRFCMIAYGIPLLIVTASKLTDHYILDSKGYGTADHCWLSSHQNFNLTFIVPVSCILFSNLIILVIVFYGMRNSMTKQVQINRNKKQEHFFRSLLGFWSVILTLLGLPWILGYLMIDDSGYIVFSYLFTLINSLQGTVVFIFHCIISKSVREELLKLLRKQKHRLLLSVTSSSSSNHSRSPMYAGHLYNQNNLLSKQATMGQARRLSNTSSLPRSSNSNKKTSSSSKSVDRKNSNSSGNNSVFHNMSSEHRLLKKGSSANPLQFMDGPRRSLFSYMYRLIRLPFGKRVDDSFGSDQSIKDSSQSSYHEQELHSPPFRSAHRVNSINEEEDAHLKLLRRNSLTKKSNSIKYNMVNVDHQQQLQQLQQQQQQQTLNRAAATNVPQMYFNPETMSNSSDNEHQKPLLKESRLLTSALENLRRASSQMSSNSSSSSSNNNNSHTISTSFESSSNSNSAKLNYRTLTHRAASMSGGVEPATVAVSKAEPSYTTLVNKEAAAKAATMSTAKQSSSFNDGLRFSTFKGTQNSSALLSPSSQGGKSSLYTNLNAFYKKNSIPQCIETPIISLNPAQTAPRKASSSNNSAYDENQYLTPEYHSYSMVDSLCPVDTQFYCEDGALNLPGIDDEISNNYVEVMDEFDDPELNYLNALNYLVSNAGGGGQTELGNNLRLSFYTDRIQRIANGMPISASTKPDSSSTIPKATTTVSEPRFPTRLKQLSDLLASTDDEFQRGNDPSATLYNNHEMRGKTLDTNLNMTQSNSSSASSPVSSADISNESNSLLDSSASVSASNNTNNTNNTNNNNQSTLLLAPDDNMKARRILKRL